MTREQVADPTYGLAGYLSTEMHAVTGTIAQGLRVFRPALPEKEEPLMPRGCVVLRKAGGGHLFGRQDLYVIDSVIDVLCYGSTRLEADEIGGEVQVLLKELSLSWWNEVKLFWARIAAGPVSNIDSDQTVWPTCLIVTQVMHSLYTQS